MSNSTKNYDLASNNENYQIFLTKNDNDLQLELSKTDNNTIYYKETTNLDDLLKKSKIFRFCDNIQEAYDTIDKIFQNKKVNLEGAFQNNDINLCFQATLPNGAEEEFKIVLKKEERKNNNETLEKLNQRIEDLESENKNLKNEVQTLKEENENKDKIIESLSQNNNSDSVSNINNSNINTENSNYYMSTMENTISNNENNENEVLVTDIIDSQDELELIENRLKEINFFSGKNIHYELIFKGTKNGDKSSTFHYNCDGIRNTLTLVKSKNGKRFGGFTCEIWNQIGGFGKKDPNAFCFSLDLKKIYNSQGTQQAILCSDGYGPYFKGVNTIFGVYNNFFTQGGWCDYTTSALSFGKFDQNFEITGGIKQFFIEDMEVFKVTCS